MKMNFMRIPFGEIANGYSDKGEEGVTAYGGRLNVRPAYQREFVYKDAQRDAVVRSVMKGLPLNVMYWVDNGDGTYGVLDGQQRTISVCSYLDGAYSIDYRYVHNLTPEERALIEDYEVLVYVCEGTQQEVLEWFRTINIATVPLTPQELRNAAYTGPWLEDAKRYFSRTGCPAWTVGANLVAGSPIRQEFLEEALKWVSEAEGCTIEEYMAVHQHDVTAAPLWAHFRTVTEWVERVFPYFRKEMKGVAWGELYLAHKDEDLDPAGLEEEIADLMEDDDVTAKRGIYGYVLDGSERRLSIRQFPPRDRRTAYERQNGVCPVCGCVKPIDEMEADHILPWSKGGRTVPENCQMLCRECNRAKGGR